MLLHGAGRGSARAVRVLGRAGRREHTHAPTAQWANAPRTHRCGELHAAHVGERVVLGGWMRTPRKISKQLAFVPLQDASGVVQLKLGDAQDERALEALCDLPVESVVSVHGTVQPRAAGAQNADMPTGAIEVVVDAWQLLNAADASLPFYATQCHPDAPLPKETLRARYRYLDLRRAALGENIRRRSRVAHAARCFLHDRHFTEIETPVLLRSTPEGAREFLVPTRGAADAPPSFYALQQSPQQPKQLLMASGVCDAYFQFAKCFRDEDGRKDRQPEFTQLDLEMSFVRGAEHAPTGAWHIGGTEVRDTTEGLVRAMWAAAGRSVAELPSGAFPVYSYADVMQRYGSDKPDVRFGLAITDLAPAVAPGTPTHALDVLVCPHYALPHGTLKLSQKQIEQALVGKDGQRSRVEHFKADAEQVQALAERLWHKSRHVAQVRHAAPADAVPAPFASALATALASANVFAGASPLARLPRCDVFVAARPLPVDGGSTEMGDVRLRLGAALAAQYTDVVRATPEILWVTEFPLFTHADADKDEAAHGRWASTHHPFTAPAAEDVDRLVAALRGGRPPADVVASIRGQHYDLVLNGHEIAGGSVRIHDARLQEAVLRSVLELTPDETQRFAHLLHALRSGAPPHAGIALGFDRLMALLCDTSSIRDVMAFPKSTAGADPLFASPAALEEGDAARADAHLAPYRLQRRRI
ncbi:aspartate--tRNA ligase [Malassezia brasiliensis]|uniref:Aspartate--tRNA ligase n=1 Tax=Malassezia brasiliensis TaxID=1821822 RepID=A0AAF0IUL2_9BASI|nr:aspartate--tRNA ligase [Malassezia brasiliensis]